MSPAIAKPFYLFWLAVLFAGSAMAAEPAPTVPDAEFADGDFAAAEHYYGDVLAKSPDDEAALAGLARIRLYQERRADARALASRVLATNPDNDLAKRVLAGADVVLEVIVHFVDGHGELSELVF